LSGEVAQGAVGEAEACGDLLQRLAFKDDGADCLVVALRRLLRIGEELLKLWVVHDRTSKMSLKY
jgi:hypothetical protein